MNSNRSTLKHYKFAKMMNNKFNLDANYINKDDEEDTIFVQPDIEWLFDNYDVLETKEEKDICYYYGRTQVVDGKKIKSGYGLKITECNDGDNETHHGWWENDWMT